MEIIEAKKRALTSDRITLIKQFMDVFAPDYLYVLVSGGKDSVAAWSLVNDAVRDYVVVYNHIPGQTHTDNVEVVYSVADKLGVKDKARVIVKETRRIRDQLRESIESCRMPCLLHVIVYTHRGEDYWSAMKRYGYPAPLGRWGMGTRWCCGVFKHRIFNRLPYNGTYNGKEWKYGVDGSKATDSPYRRKIYVKDIMTWVKTRDTYLLPLRTLSNEDVWTILRFYGLYEIVHKQYEVWGRAPNCTFCPMLSRRKAEITVKAMSPAMRKHISGILKEIRGRYKETTFSYRSINTWLQLLGDNA